jgi:glycosyltransferase involved in cell wall biosynthesis
MSQPLVSIIVPSFNQAQFLKQTLESIFVQDYPNLEVWVMDGGSTDGSVEIIRAYADRLTGWVSEPDRGQADGINKGFRKAHGEIVAWLNSDDVYQPGTVSKAGAALSDQPQAVMVYGDVISMDGDGKVINLMRYGDWGLPDLMRFEIIGQPAVFMRQSALEQAGLLDLDYHYLLDHHLWLRVAQQGAMLHVPEFWASARFHAGAKNRAHAAEFGEEAYRIVDWMLTDPGLSDLALRDFKRILSGAHRINARYLLDGGLPRQAFAAYLQSVRMFPRDGLREWRRMGFSAISSIVNIDAIKGMYLQKKRQRAEREHPNG